MDEFLVDEIKKKLVNFKNLEKSELSNIIFQIKKIKINKDILRKTEFHKDLVKIAKFYAKNEEYHKLVDNCIKIRKSWKTKLKESNEKTNGVNKEKKEILETKEEIGNENKKLENCENTFHCNLEDSNRSSSVKLIYEKLKKFLLSKKELQELYFNRINDIAHDIESSVWELQNKNLKNYKRYIRERLLILAEKKNIDIIENLILGNYSVEYFVKTDLKDLIDKKLKEKELEDKSWAMKSMQSDFYIKNCPVKEGEFECFKCKSRKILTTQKQMRSADEPMTTFFNCVDCSNNWKMN